MRNARTHLCLARSLASTFPGSRHTRGAVNTRRRACSPLAGVWSVTACCVPTEAASSRGSAMGSRSCGGARTRAWCCRWTIFRLHPIPAQDLAAALSARPRCEIRIRHRFRLRDCALRPSQPRGVGERHLDLAAMMQAGLFGQLHRGRFMRTVSRPGSTASWSVACTAWRSGKAVFGESMFSTGSDASKIALAALVAFCRAHGITGHRLPAEHAPPGVAGRGGNAALGNFWRTAAAHRRPGRRRHGISSLYTGSNPA
jgi:hypothetical protein